MVLNCDLLALAFQSGRTHRLPPFSLLLFSGLYRNISLITCNDVIKEVLFSFNFVQPVNASVYSPRLLVISQVLVTVS
jgi:hypothetical protein